MKSILQEKDGRCCLCMMLHGDGSRKTVQEHHVIYGTSGRKLSERYGLKVYLCLWHHLEGPEAVHRNAEVSRMLKIIAQRAFRERFPELNWMEIFGKNYDTDDTEHPESRPADGQQDAEPGFVFLGAEEGHERH